MAWKNKIHGIERIVAESIDVIIVDGYERRVRRRGRNKLVGYKIAYLRAAQ